MEKSIPDFEQDFYPEGFDFELHARNQLLEKKFAHLPTLRKTGTTIVGLIYKDGIMLAADTRATSGTTVCDKKCIKINYIAPNIYCCGSGGLADCVNVCLLCSSQLELLRRQTNKQSRVVAAKTILTQRLFQYHGYLQAGLILGGVDSMGTHLYNIWPDGCCDERNFLTSGSGCLAASSVLETNYREGLNEDEAKELIADAITAGIFNDLGSGGNVNIRVIRKDGTTDYYESYRHENDISQVYNQYQRPNVLNLPPGVTTVISETITNLNEN
ncbi:hypothetical protein WA158_000006 [Blastocystis sp. Blastoise]